MMFWAFIALVLLSYECATIQIQLYSIKVHVGCGMGRGKEGDVIASKMLKDSLKTAWLTRYLDLTGYLGKKKLCITIA